VVVLAAWLSNSSPPPLLRALAAYRQLDLTAVTTPVARQQAKRARQLTAAERSLLVERYQAGATVYDLAREFTISRSTASRQIKKSGVVLRNGPLNPDEVVRAIELYATGLSTAAVGQQLGRDAGTIWRALKAASVPLRDTHGRERASS
jgi:hypothetical protein